MHKPSPPRLSAIMGIAASIGLMNAVASTAEVFKTARGAAPPGYKRRGGVYWPGNINPNVEPTRVRNPKIRANVQMMHERWLEGFKARHAE